MLLRQMVRMFEVLRRGAREGLDGRRRGGEERRVSNESLPSE
jgi:hypothetical protein